MRGQVTPVLHSCHDLHDERLTKYFLFYHDGYLSVFSISPNGQGDLFVDRGSGTDSIDLLGKKGPTIKRNVMYLESIPFVNDASGQLKSWDSE